MSEIGKVGPGKKDALIKGKSPFSDRPAAIPSRLAVILSIRYSFIRTSNNNGGPPWLTWLSKDICVSGADTAGRRATAQAYGIRTNPSCAPNAKAPTGTDRARTITRLTNALAVGRTAEQSKRQRSEAIRYEAAAPTQEKCNAQA